MRLLDEVGLEELTTRRLADRLGVQVGGLYWHVKDKRDLLIALTDRIVAEAADPGPAAGDWIERLVTGARRLRAAMLRHRDGARLVSTYATASRQSLVLAEESLRAMIECGLPLRTAALAGDLVVSYTTGFVLQEQLDGLPTLARWLATKPATKDDAFATGLDMIVAGIHARLPTSGT
jgi:TetR/AcrR family tetracycline transcriptional repressor